MKSEERKKEDRELIERLLSNSNGIDHTLDSNYKKFTIDTDRVNHFIESEGLTEKPKLEFNRWIKEKNSLFMFDKKNDCIYGICENEWYFSDPLLVSPIDGIHNRYATDGEILKELSKIAIKKGYNKKQSECLTDVGRDELDLDNIIFSLDDNYSLWIKNSRYKSNCIFRNGKWADFIEPKTDRERIEELEKDNKKAEILKRISILSIESIRVGNGLITKTSADLTLKYDDIIKLVNEL